VTRVAKDTLILGRLGEIHAGQEIPAKYTDPEGNEQPTDFARLEELGLVEKKPSHAKASHTKPSK
jgi:hypothetical protein